MSVMTRSWKMHHLPMMRLWKMQCAATTSSWKMQHTATMRLRKMQKIQHATTMRLRKMQKIQHTAMMRKMNRVQMTALKMKRKVASAVLVSQSYSHQRKNPLTKGCNCFVITETFKHGWYYIKVLRQTTSCNRNRSCF